jgi:hypothetical protein
LSATHPLLWAHAMAAGWVIFGKQTRVYFGERRSDALRR